MILSKNCHRICPSTAKKQRLILSSLYLFMAVFLIGISHVKAQDGCTVVAGGAVAIPVNGNEISVNGSNDLRSKLRGAGGGDIFVLAAGNYTGDFKLERSGSASSPIVIRPAPGARVVFDSAVLELNGNYGIATGLVFNNGQVTIWGDNNRVAGNIFDKGQPGGNQSRLSSAVIVHGNRNTIDYNSVTNWQRRGLRVKPQRGNTPKGNHFHHNYLDNFNGDANRNAGDALQIGSGTSDTIHVTNTIMEYNFLNKVESDGEALSVKSSGSVIRYNTFQNSDATFNIRHGANNALIGNTLKDVKAMSAYGRGHSIIGNNIQNSHLILPRGDVLEQHMEAVARGQNSIAGPGKNHPASENAYVACNIVNGGYIGVGTRIPGGGSYHGFPAINTTLASNQGRIEYDNPRQDRGTREITANCAGIQAVEVTPEEVGPWALDPNASAPAQAEGSCGGVDDGYLDEISNCDDRPPPPPTPFEDTDPDVQGEGGD